MISYLSGKLADSLKAAVPNHPTSTAVLKYSISFLLNAVFVIVLSLTVSLFTGHWKEALTVLAAFPLLRQVSGGIHLKSSMTCVLVSTGGTTLLSFLSLDYTWTIALTCVSCLLVLLFAPSRIEKQSRIPRKYYPLLKLISLLIVSSNFWIASPVLAGTFLVQAVTLIKVRG